MKTRKDNKNSPIDRELYYTYKDKKGNRTTAFKEKGQGKKWQLFTQDKTYSKVIFSKKLDNLKQVEKYIRDNNLEPCKKIGEKGFRW